MLAPNKKRKIEPRNRERLPERLIILLHNFFFFFFLSFFHFMCYFPWFGLLFVRSLSVSHTFSVCVSPRFVPLYCPFSFFVYLMRFCSVCVFYSTLLQHYNKYTEFLFCCISFHTIHFVGIFRFVWLLIVNIPLLSTHYKIHIPSRSTEHTHRERHTLSRRVI